MTPEEGYSGIKPNLAMVEQFGRRCWVLDQDGNRDKLQAKASKFIFTGIASGTKGYRYYSPASQKILTSRNVVFSLEEPQRDTRGGDDEVALNQPLLLEGENAAEEDKLTTTDHYDTAPMTPAKPTIKIVTPLAPSKPRTATVTPKGPVKVQPPQVLRAKSERLASKRPVDYKALNAGKAPKSTPGSASKKAWAFVAESTPEPVEPQSVEEAMAQPEWPKWKEAMDKEIGQHEKLGTYRRVELPEGRKPITCKWVFRIKRNAEGKITQFKARLVARGYAQIPGIDYDETFSPVMRTETLRLLCAIATHLGLKIHVVDAVGAYLNGTLEEEIYMTQPPGYDDLSSKFLLLILSIYGLKQAGRTWNTKLNADFIDLGFKRLSSDQCVYFRQSDDKIEIIAVHVDDMALFTTDDTAMDILKKQLASKFEISDLGPIKQMVGYEFTRDESRRLMKVSQTQYISRVLEKFGMADSTPVKTPLDANVKLEKTPEGESHDIPAYRHAIGSLMYAATGTRPDIAFAVQHLSQFSSNPSPAHWTAIKRVLCYLNGTKNLGIIYGLDDNFDPTGYADADWGSNPIDRKSISGYTYLVAGGPVSWRSKKQPTIALSTMEAEYQAASLATREAAWLRHLYEEIGSPSPNPTTLNLDNRSAIDFAKNSGFHARSKHIDIQHHFVREKIVSNEIVVFHCPSAENIADIFTKPLPAPAHEYLVSKLNMDTEFRGSVGNGNSASPVEDSVTE